MFLVADWHVLTTDYTHTQDIADNIYETLYDWLGAGINPKLSTIFLQSKVPEHAELTLLFSNIITVGRLERNPTYKEQRRELGLDTSASLGLLSYPVLQAADILMYCADVVPVGEDQLPHLELTREIGRRFNSLYGELFPEPQAILSPTPRLVGTDGRTMHTSYGNAIALAEEPDIIRRKVMGMVTDAQRIRITIPGRPESCTVFSLMQGVTPRRSVANEALCRRAEIGCVACKEGLAQELIEMLEPFRRIRQEVSRADLDAILCQGNARARRMAGRTMSRVRSVMKLDRVSASCQAMTPGMSRTASRRMSSETPSEPSRETSPGLPPQLPSESYPDVSSKTFRRSRDGHGDRGKG